MVIPSNSVLLVASISVMLVFPCSRAAAQDPQPAGATPPADGTQGQPAPDAAGLTEQTSHDRLFGMVPNFLTVNDSGSIRPLTTAQKYNVVTRTAFDWFQFGWYTAKSGIDQWHGNEADYGNGIHGYGKRWASNFADGTAENYFVGAVWPSLLHQDPRHFRKATGRFGSRIGYAVTRVFVTRGDSGHHQFNFSEILGASTATLLANIYHPAADRTVDSNVELMSLLVSYDMLANMLKEFWPDVSKPRTRHNAHDTPANTP
jgi:hypothetical protein